MTAAPITIEPMHERYNAQVSRLLVHGFRGKFQTLTKMNDDELSLFFEKLFDHFPNEPATQRMVAIQDGKVVGSISIKWDNDSHMKQQSILRSWESFRVFGKWNLYKMLLGLHLLEHKPKPGECYIADVVVHPDCRSIGVGKLLLNWTHHFVQSDSRLDKLSLFVSGSNPRAKRLYEELSFQSQLQKNSFIRHLLFNEKTWHYMVMRVK